MLETRVIQFADGGADVSAARVGAGEITMAKYNPQGWNEYPRVKPPVGVVMCLEVRRHTFSSLLYPCREGRRFIAIWKSVSLPVTDENGQITKYVTENRWVDENGTLIETYGSKPEEKTFKARFRPWNLVRVPQYDPHTWNQYPDVKPPVDQLMRIEGRNKHSGERFYYAGYYTNIGWCDMHSTYLPEYEVVERFRPWGEE